MEKFPPSIFNDVIGPVMRGPSSSHVAGASRIANIVRQSLRDDVVKVVVDFDTNGSLAESHDGHGTDMGFVSGIMGIEMTDPSVLRAEELAKSAGVEVEFRILDYGAEHPNNYRIHAFNKAGASHVWEAISVGGGMIEMWKFDGFNVRIAGDFHELLFVVEALNGVDNARGAIDRWLPKFDAISVEERADKILIAVKYSVKPDLATLDKIRETAPFLDIVYLKPILPTHSSASCSVPFKTATELLNFAKAEKRELWEFAALYESCRGSTTQDDVFKKMNDLVSIMEKSVESGLAGTQYADRILGPQAYKIAQSGVKGRLVPCDILNTAIQCITALMEVKSSMGVIVAAPTAGSCGCLPGTLLGVGRAMRLPREDVVKGMLAAGLIGVFIAEMATFAAEVGGCQVECGAGSGMAAAGVAQMLGGSVEECLDAASMALQNVTGLACDPVANRVEVPCLGKNVMGGSNAIASANMALAGFDSVIPLDQTIMAIYDIGSKLPLELRCTFGGLGKTAASIQMRERLKRRDD